MRASWKRQRRAWRSGSWRCWSVVVWLSCLGCVSCLSCSNGSLATQARAENWPNWRGPRWNSTSEETGLPLFWRVDSGVAWHTELPGWGDSTPIVWNDAVFVTTQEDRSLDLLRLDIRTGQVVWRQTVVEAPEQPPREAKRGRQKFHRLHNFATPSPTTDGETVVVHFGEGTLAAYDFAGRRLWRRNLQRDFGAYTVWWGHANSPVLFEDLVISVCMQDSLTDLGKTPARSYLVAHDIRSGRQRWFTPRPTEAQAEQCDAYTTPLLRRGENGQTELIVMGGNQLDAYDPRTGQQLWAVPRLVGGRTVTSPTAHENLLVATVGMRGPMIVFDLARPTADGQPKRLWKYDAGTADSCSPVFCSGLLFVVTDRGIGKCFDARTGHLRWKRRLVGGDYKATPLAADDRIYFLSRDGVCTVVSASARFDQLARNRLDDEFLASPIASQGHLFLRGRKRIYCIGPVWP